MRLMFMMKRDNAMPSASSTPTVMVPLDEGKVSLPAQTVCRCSLRRLWLSTHLYLGLFGGALFVLMSLTGSVLVFYKTIDEWLNPTQLTTSGSGPYRPLNEVIATAQAAASSGGWLDNLELPSHEREVFKAWYRVPTDKLDRFRWYLVTIDPYTGSVLSRDREWGTFFVSFIYELHESLLIDELGRTLVGFVAIFLLVSIGTGVFLWWPRSGKVRQAFLPVAGASRIRRQYQWHRLSGAYSVIVLSMLAFTGVYLAFPTYVISLVSVFSPVDEAHDESTVESHPASGQSALSVEQAAGLAQSLFQDGRITYIGIPHEPSDVYQITMHRPGDVRDSTGNSEVWLDQYSGAVLKVRDWRTFTAGDTFVAWLFPLHNGEAFGLIGRWIVFVCGFVPLILYVTALRVWWLKRRAHRR
ncbi:MAG: PepSY domain-containing protein [Nitrospirae bacterium]|nr:PepSY domain-containing protein [Nitrospirota bacterium]